MAAPPKHSEHEYIVAQLKKYIEAYNSGYTEKMMKFMDKSNLVYSDFSQSLHLAHYHSLRISG